MIDLSPLSVDLDPLAVLVAIGCHYSPDNLTNNPDLAVAFQHAASLMVANGKYSEAIDYLHWANRALNEVDSSEIINSFALAAVDLFD